MNNLHVFDKDEGDNDGNVEKELVTDTYLVRQIIHDMNNLHVFDKDEGDNDGNVEKELVTI
jgi:hypothetical protein